MSQIPQDFRRITEDRIDAIFHRHLSSRNFGGCLIGEPLPNSLLTGKRTGNFVETASFVRLRMLTRKHIQRLLAEFPTQ